MVRNVGEYICLLPDLETRNNQIMPYTTLGKDPSSRSASSAPDNVVGSIFFSIIPI